MIAGSASLTKSPRTNAGACSVKVPSSATGRQTCHPCARPTARSSGPKAGAMWTIPVPSSIETKSAATTVCAFADVGVRRFVARTNQAASLVPVPEGPSVAEDRGQRLGDDDALLAAGQQQVLGVGCDRRAGVGRQRPRGGRPHRERSAHEVGIGGLHDREPQKHARILDPLVALRDLGIRQRRAAARAVRRDLVVLDQQSALMEPLERPPHRLDVGRRHRPVGIRHISSPAAPSAACSASAAASSSSRRWRSSSARPRLEAEATSLLVIVPMAIVGTWRQHRHGNVDLRDGITIGLLSVPGVIVGVVVANALPQRALELGFAALSLVVARSSCTARSRSPPEEDGGHG